MSLELISRIFVASIAVASAYNAVWKHHKPPHENRAAELFTMATITFGITVSGDVVAQTLIRKWRSSKQKMSDVTN
jgi:hypothetical protein